MDRPWCGGGRGPYPAGSLTRHLIELALALQMDPDALLDQDTRIINTVTALAEERARR